jgi:hypothetical protein
MMTQFVTLDDAKAIAKQLGDVGGGVLPYNPNTVEETVEPDRGDNQASGIYIPTYVGPFSTPADGAARFYHLRFRNGADGFNAGLIKITMTIFPTRWPLMLASEVNAVVRAYGSD